MIYDEYTIRLSEHCFNVCETLKDALQGRNLGDFRESERAAMGGLGRCVS